MGHLTAPSRDSGGMVGKIALARDETMCETLPQSQVRNSAPKEAARVMKQSGKKPVQLIVNEEGGGLRSPVSGLDLGPLVSAGSQPSS